MRTLLLQNPRVSGIATFSAIKRTAMRTVAYLVGGLIVLVGSFLITNWILSRNDGVNWKFTDEASLAAAAKTAGYHSSKDLGGHVDYGCPGWPWKGHRSRMGCRYFRRRISHCARGLREWPQISDAFTLKVHGRILQPG